MVEKEKDIVERLRLKADIVDGLVKRGTSTQSTTMREAADEIERLNALRAEVEDWKDNYNKATDACVALRAENARLRERLRFDYDEGPYAHIDSLQSENAKLREALELLTSCYAR